MSAVRWRRFSGSSRPGAAHLLDSSAPCQYRRNDPQPARFTPLRNGISSRGVVPNHQVPATFGIFHGRALSGRSPPSSWVTGPRQSTWNPNQAASAGKRRAPICRSRSASIRCTPIRSQDASSQAPRARTRRSSGLAFDAGSDGYGLMAPADRPQPATTGGEVSVNERDALSAVGTDPAKGAVRINRRWTTDSA